MIVSKLPAKALVGAAVLLCLSSSATYASDWDEEPADSQLVIYKEGNVGMGAGALTGAAVGGPPGLVIGALVGKLYGRQAGMQASIDAGTAEKQRLLRKVDGQSSTIASLREQQHREQMMLASLGDVPMQTRPPLEDLLKQGFAYTVHFRTASDRIEEHLQQQCRALSRIAHKLPGLRVRLEGYADSRGDEDYNLNLSHQRLQAVKALLIEEGIAEDRIHIHARGEQQRLNLGEDADSYAFDRRVVITFIGAETQS